MTTLDRLAILRAEYLAAVQRADEARHQLLTEGQTGRTLAYEAYWKSVREAPAAWAAYEAALKEVAQVFDRADHPNLTGTLTHKANDND